MPVFDQFVYSKERENQIRSDGFVVHIPVGINSSQQLLEILYERLRFPGYFGFNWDALADCLRDFHWIEQPVVTLVHYDLPWLNTVDLTNYIDVLDQSVCDQNGEQRHRLVVIFPETCRAAIEHLADGKR